MEAVVSEATTPSTESLPEYSGYRMLTRIHQEGLWVFQPTNEPWAFATKEERIQNRSRVLTICQEEIALAESKNPELPEYDLPADDVLQAMTQRATNWFASYCAKSGVLPKEAVILASKLTKGSEITMPRHSQGATALDRRNDVTKFPQTKDERATIFISPDMIRHQSQYYLSVAHDLDIELSPQQAVAAAIAAIAAHEWGHVLERALITQYLVIVSEIDERILSESFLATFDKAADVLFEPISQMADPLMTDTRQSNQKFIHKERWATSFEEIALEPALVAADLPAESARKMIRKIQEEKDARLREFLELRRGLGMTDIELLNYTMDIRHTLGEAGLQADYIPDFPEGAGYLGRYTKEQITASVKMALAKLNRQDVKKDLQAAA